MSEHVRVELVQRTRPADGATRAGRERVVKRLAGLGQIDPAAGEVNTQESAWCARIGGVEFPVEACGVELGDDGLALVSLVVAADSVAVGDPSTDGVQPQVRPAVPTKNGRQVWGAPGRPDPREGIPGWKPQVTDSDTAAHDHTLAKWTCGCDPVLLGIQDAARRTGNIDLRVMEA